jgi:uncharacterized cupredoxin-like copper-binding protein
MNMTTHRLLRAVRLAPVALLLAACSTAAGGPGWTFAPLGPTSAPTASASPSGSPTGTVIELAMTSSLQFTQGGQPIDSLELAVGEEYTFRVTNSAGFVHNIWLATPEQLAADDTDGQPGLDDFETGTQEFSWTPTAEAEGWEFGCTVTGHYQAGMKGTLVLTGGE